MIEYLSRLNTKAFAIAALEELVVLLSVTCYVLAGGTYALPLWSALFMAFAVHLLVHVGQAMVGGVCTGFRHFTPAGALCCLRTAEHLARDEQRGTHRMGRCRHSSDGGKSTFRPLAGHSILQEKQICQLNQLKKLGSSDISSDATIM
ncbi:MAG: hypothetical protein PUF62_00055 [Bacteroidales bacterium]|nr:hypothetical protein [Bacteroidales bacterium]